MPMLTVGSVEIPYVLRRSDAATRARITVTPDSVEVVVPTAATEDEIAGVLHRRRAWLYEQTRNMAERMAHSNAVRRFVSGAKIPYRGRLMRLRVEPSDDTLVSVAYRNGFLVGCPQSVAPSFHDDLIESALRLWLRKRLRQDVADLVRRHGEPNGLKPKDVLVKDQKHVWGSCGIDRVVNLNWQLVFAPRTVLEYAVVHELCHLRHRNHDRSFWGLVGTILPDWEARKAWLDQNEHFLTLRRVEPT
ncbi:SprT family zinc-dependent metalloprotease [Azospirillum sp.]|uniref:M48 family metallopeptidase n=1 Tax=Azospirillum sp. TaxID=34012 RepID=UPI002D62822D|nr:SprT family zinc-dependent metalloprotease [Azospirillum sp.]HYD66682.1 SprT family zinc-dependent metalloprotease [Azospirillum sp.]